MFLHDPLSVLERIQKRNGRGFRRISHRGFLLSSIQYPVSSIQYRVSSIEYPVSSIQYRVSSIEYPVSVFYYPVSNIEYLVWFSIIQYQISSIWYGFRVSTSHSGQLVTVVTGCKKFQKSLDKVAQNGSIRMTEWQ